MHNIGHNVTFYGADPIVEGNSVLYSKIGKYFPFAVGEKAGFSMASVLSKGGKTYEVLILIFFEFPGEYISMPVVHVDLYYFLKEVLGEKVRNILNFKTKRLFKGY